MSQVLSVEALRDKRDRKLGRTGACQNQPWRRERPDFERRAAGVEDREPGRFAWSVEAQERMAHWLAQWGPVWLVIVVAVMVGWLLLG